MRALSEIYRDLVTAGASPEIIALAIEAYESGGQSGMSGGMSGGQAPERSGQTQAEKDAHERRKAWDRDYRARRRAEKSGGQVDESGGQRADLSPPSSPLVPPLDGFPQPLPKTPPIIPPPSAPHAVRAPEPPGAGALRAEADARRAQAKRWPEFRATYPKREGSQSWPAAEKKYIALVASGVAEQTIIDGAHRYSDSLRASGSLGTRFVKHASAWLNQKGWEDEYLAGTGTGRRPGSDLMDAFDNRIREAEDRAGHRAPGEGNGDWAGTIDATFTEI